MSILDFFKAAPKLTNDVFDKDNGHLAKIGGWIGNQQFTEQEQKVMNKEIAKGVQEFAVATLSENTDRSKTRRKTAVMWFKLQVQLIKLTVLCVFIDYLAIKFTDQTEYLLTGKVAEITFSPMLWGITGAIATFFYGAHILRSSKLAKD